jgi:hypothetical protein
MIVITKYARFGTVLSILAAGLAVVTSLPAGAISSGGVAAGGVLELTVGGTAGVPTDALAVVLNATVTNPAAAGFVTVFPCGTERPVASNLNYVKDQTVPNLVIAKLGAGGKVCFYSQQAVDLIVDVAGFFPAGSGYVAQASPQRAADTRGKTRVGGTTIQEVAVAGVFGVPTTAAGVALNVTVTGAAADGFATVFPCGQQPPTASNVNYAKGQDIPNFVIATPGVGGKVCVFSSASADVIVDVSGYFEQGTGFIATAAPVRVLDSRETTRIAAGTSKELTVAGDKGIPADARGVAMNVTAVGASADGFMTVYPCGQSIPVASNLNYTKARDVANFVLAKPGTNGKVCFYSDKTVDIIVDVAGYYGPDSTFTPVPNPARILDTREAKGLPSRKTYGEGTYRGGVDLPVGFYEFFSTAGQCTLNMNDNLDYWGGLVGFRVLFEVRSTDYVRFDCSTFSNHLPPASPAASFETFADQVVGVDIMPGRYRASTPECSWTIWRDFAFGLGHHPEKTGYGPVVEIPDSAGGFSSRGCGSWNRVTP